MRFFVAALAIIFHTSFSHAEDSSFRFTFGSTLGKFPIKIDKQNAINKTIGSIKINSWAVSPNFSSLVGKNEISNITKDINIEEKNFGEILYMKINFKF